MKAQLLSRKSITRIDEGGGRSENQIDRQRRQRDLRAVPQAPRHLARGIGNHRPVGARLQVGRRQFAGEDETVVLQRHLVEKPACRWRTSRDRE